MFSEKISDLERQLANIICQGFDDCSGMQSIFKVITRPFILTAVKTLVPAAGCFKHVHSFFELLFSYLLAITLIVLLPLPFRFVVL